MATRPGYTFSKKRLFVHIFLTVITSLIWVPFGAIWEWYRYINAR